MSCGYLSDHRPDMADETIVWFLASLPMIPRVGSGVRCVRFLPARIRWEIYEASGIDPYFYAQR